MVIEKFLTLAPKGSTDRLAVTKLITAVAEQYCAPHRHYHNLSHLEAGLHHYFNFCRDIDVTDFFAWVYHDVVYRPLDSYNEAKSASYFLNDAPTLGFNTEDALIIVDKILGTDHSKPSMGFVNDMDLSILGEDSPTYFMYAANVYREYVPPLTTEAFNLGRIQVLERLLSFPSIYFTNEFKILEIPARDNIQAELGQLKKVVTHA
jgi:predicted metal-dependent HD superfamily phosphohydrolase